MPRGIRVGGGEKRKKKRGKNKINLKSGERRDKSNLEKLLYGNKSIFIWINKNIYPFGTPNNRVFPLFFPIFLGFFLYFFLPLRFIFSSALGIFSPLFLPDFPSPGIGDFPGISWFFIFIFFPRLSWKFQPGRSQWNPEIPGNSSQKSLKTPRGFFCSCREFPNFLPLFLWGKRREKKRNIFLINTDTCKISEKKF